MRIALCQLPISPEPAINLERVTGAMTTAARLGADLAVFPEATQARFGSDLRAVADSLGERESALVAPGSEPVVADLAGTRTGFATCYDIRFPELFRTLVARGAELIVVPGAWAAGLFKEEHWVTLVRARAIENTVWVAAAGQVPDPASPPTRAPTGVGRSMLVDPMGAVRTDLGLWPQVAVAELDSAMTARVRAVLPCLEHRRDDVFGPAGPADPTGAD